MENNNNDKTKTKINKQPQAPAFIKERRCIWVDTRLDSLVKELWVSDEFVDATQKISDEKEANFVHKGIPSNENKERQ